MESHYSVDNINKEIRPSQPTLYYCNFHRQLLCFDYFLLSVFLLEIRDVVAGCVLDKCAIICGSV